MGCFCPFVEVGGGCLRLLDWSPCVAVSFNSSFSKEHFLTLQEIVLARSAHQGENHHHTDGRVKDNECHSERENARRGEPAQGRTYIISGTPHTGQGSRIDQGPHNQRQGQYGRVANRARERANLTAGRAWSDRGPFRRRTNITTRSVTSKRRRKQYHPEGGAESSTTQGSLCPLFLCTGVAAAFLPPCGLCCFPRPSFWWCCFSLALSHNSSLEAQSSTSFAPPLHV